MFTTDHPYDSSRQETVSLAIVGCGARAQTYVQIACRTPQKFRVVAIADPNPAKRQAIRDLAGGMDIQEFESADLLLKHERLADVLVISTQDAQHYEQCRQAIVAGYHILLEKPVAQSSTEVRTLVDLARQKERRVVVCFVLRHTSFFRRIKKLIDNGRIGDVTSLNLVEGIGTWPNVHAYVRGHWSRTQDSTPKILAKSSHDTDMIAWLLDDTCVSVSSFGQLGYYRHENKPSDATTRCTDGCPHLSSCEYSAYRYADDMRSPWLIQIHPDGETMSRDEVEGWLRESPYGRCAWQCDNDVVDHQVVAMKFSKGCSATFTMTAFDAHRHIEIFGTKGVLRAGMDGRDELGCDILIRNHDNDAIERIVIDADDDSGYEAHGGGDAGLMDAIYGVFRGDTNDEVALLATAAEAHYIGFAAEESRLSGRTVEVAEQRG